MKVYILKESDLESLKDKLSVDPKIKSVLCNTDKDKEMFDGIYRFYNYIVCKWIDEIKRDE